MCALSLPHRFRLQHRISHLGILPRSLPWVILFGVVHRATRVSIVVSGWCACVCPRVHRVHRVLRVLRVLPLFPIRFRVNSQDRATNGVLDLIIWYQQPLVSANLTPHPPNFVSKIFPKKSPKNSPNLPFDGSAISLRFEWFWSMDLVSLVLIYYFPHFLSTNSFDFRVWIDLV